jgi:hypothetical protein
MFRCLTFSVTLSIITTLLVQNSLRLKNAPYIIVLHHVFNLYIIFSYVLVAINELYEEKEIEYYVYHGMTGNWQWRKLRNATQ